MPLGKHLPYQRSDRLSDLLRKIVSETLMSKVHHRGLEEVTITEVKVSPDLKHARVYYRVLDLNKKKQLARSLAKVASFVQRELAHEMKTRYTPHLRFEYDESADYGSHIDSLLASVHLPEEEE